MAWKWRYFGGDFPSDYNGICLNTDYRVWLLYERYMRNPDVIDAVKVSHAAKHCLSNYDNDWIDANIINCVNAMQWFYDCGHDNNPSGKQPNEKMVEVLTKDKKPDIYSYYYDVRHIWGAFMSAYNIDLFKENMHWWRFKTLFDNLPSSNTFGHIKHMRSIEKKDVVTIKAGKDKIKQEKEWGKILVQQMIMQLPEY